jgi:hypothetical protein
MHRSLLVREGEGRNQVTSADAGRAGLLEPLLLDDEASTDEEAGGDREHQPLDVVRRHALDPAPVPRSLGGGRLRGHTRHWAAKCPRSPTFPEGTTPPLDRATARARSGRAEG